MAILKRPVCVTAWVFVVVATLFSTAPGRTDDFSNTYLWKPVKIGAGGWMRGMAIDADDPVVRYARGDVDDLYRWNASAGTWVPTKIESAFPENIASAPTQAGCGAIAIDPKNPRIVLCAYTFYRSADIQATNPSIKLNVYRSVDDGRTFTPGDLALSGDLTNETNGEHLAIDPNNDLIVYFGSPQDGFWKSLDGGKTWTKLNLLYRGKPVVNAGLPRFDPVAGTVTIDGRSLSRRVVLTTESGGILMSSDGGLTWADIGVGSDIDGHAGFTTVASDGSVWTTEQYGSHLWRYDLQGGWTSFQMPFDGLSGVAVDPKNIARIFAISGGGALARSLDGGRTWTTFGEGLTFSDSQPITWLRPSSIRPQFHYISNGGIYIDVSGRLWIPGANDGILSAATDDRVDTSTHPPVFSAISEGIEEMVGQEIALPPGGKPVLSVEDETCFTVENPDTFSARHFDLNLWDNNDGLSSAQDISYCPNVPSYIVITSDNVFSNDPTRMSSHFSGYSTDGGETWAKFRSILLGSHPSVLYNGIIAVGAASVETKTSLVNRANIVWVGSNKFNAHCPAPFYSFDGGRTWAQSRSFDTAPGAYSENVDGSIYQFMDNLWGPWNSSLQQHSLVADPLKPGTFYLYLTAGGFWRSDDGGMTWAQTKASGSAQIPGYGHHAKLAANPQKSGDLWLVDGFEGATAHGLWHTVDGGDSFQKIPGFDYCWALALGTGRDALSYPAIYVYGKRTSITAWGVFRSTDAGRSWNQISHYPTGLLDVPAGMAASWDRFGLVYLGFKGNSFVYGAPTRAAM